MLISEDKIWIKQVAQLSQRDHAAGWESFGQKSGKLERGNNILRPIIGLS